MPLDQAALDAHCNAVVEASSSLAKGEDAKPMIDALTELAKAAGQEYAAEVEQLVSVIDAIETDANIVNKADVVYDTVAEFRDAILAKADQPAPQAADEMDVMLGALGKSVLSILDVAPDADKGELLNKSFAQFADAAKGYVGAVAENSFDAGLNADMAKMDNDNGGLAKGMNHVAGFALLLRQLEYFLETWANEVDEESAEGADHAQQQAGGTNQQPPKGLVAAAQWYQLGQEVLKVLVHNATGDDSQGDDQGQDQGDDQSQDDQSGAAEGEDGNQEAEPPPPPPKAPPPPPHGQQPQQPPQQGQQPPQFQRRPFGKSDSADDLKKMDDILAKVDAVSAENAELKKQLDGLKKLPAQAKGVTIGIPKHADTMLKGDASEADLLAKAEALSKMTPEDRALALIKMAPARAFSTPGIPS